MTRRKELMDQQWEKIAPLLSPQKSPRGRPAKDHRSVVNAILWVVRIGVPWRDLPERYGPWQTAGRYPVAKPEGQSMGVGPASQAAEASEAHFCVPPLRNGALVT